VHSCMTRVATVTWFSQSVSHSKYCFRNGSHVMATFWKIKCLYYDPRWQDLLHSVRDIAVHNGLQAAAVSYCETIRRPSASP
jgi:hypothetical protein